MDARGDGEFVVAIRSALINGTRARLYAGCGIVGGVGTRTRVRGIPPQNAVDALGAGMSLAAQGDDPGTVLAGYVGGVRERAGAGRRCAMLAPVPAPARRRCCSLCAAIPPSAYGCISMSGPAAFFALGIAKAGREPVAGGFDIGNGRAELRSRGRGGAPGAACRCWCSRPTRPHELRSVGRECRTMGPRSACTDQRSSGSSSLPFQRAGLICARYAGATAARAAALGCRDAGRARPYQHAVPGAACPPRRARVPKPARCPIWRSRTPERRPTPDQTLALLDRLRSERGLIVWRPARGSGFSRRGR